MIDQWPVLAAMHLGVQTPHGVALVFSLVTNLLPGLIILLCLPAMPTSERHFFIFPCLRLFRGHTQRPIRERDGRTGRDILFLALAMPHRLRPFYNLALGACHGARFREPAST